MRWAAESEEIVAGLRDSHAAPGAAPASQRLLDLLRRQPPPPDATSPFSVSAGGVRTAPPARRRPWTADGVKTAASWAEAGRARLRSVGATLGRLPPAFGGYFAFGLKRGEGLLRAALWGGAAGGQGTAAGAGGADRGLRSPKALPLPRRS
jgi:hypothetical protein